MNQVMHLSFKKTSLLQAIECNFVSWCFWFLAGSRCVLNLVQSVLNLLALYWRTAWVDCSFLPHKTVSNLEAWDSVKWLRPDSHPRLVCVPLLVSIAFKMVFQLFPHPHTYEPEKQCRLRPIKVQHIGQPRQSKAIIIFKYGFSWLVYYACAHRWVLTWLLFVQRGDKREVNLPSAFLFTDVFISMYDVFIFM
jgi:hypothetical protein